MKNICLNCQIEFPVCPSRIKIGKGKFCSRVCKNFFQIGKDSFFKGKKHTKESKAKMRLARLGKKTSEETKRRLSKVLKGRIFSEEHKKKLSESAEKRKVPREVRDKISKTLRGHIPWNKDKPFLAIRGENNPNWKNGISRINQLIRASFEYNQWKKEIKKRDNYTCQICGIQKGYLHSNHIKKFSDYPNLRFELTNGITICRNCDNRWVMRHEEEWESYFNFNLATRGFLEDKFIKRRSIVYE